MSHTNDAAVGDELLAEMMKAGLVAPPAEIVVDDDELETVERKLEILEAREEVYAEQPGATVDESLEGLAEVTTLVASAEGVTETATPVKKARKPRSAPAKPREKRADAGDNGTYFAKLALGGDTSIALTKGADPVNIVELVNKLPKKVQEKVVNIADHFHNGKKLSIYTKLAVDLINAGEIKMADLVKHYMDNNYTIGTARSQAQQLFTVLRQLQAVTTGPSGGIVRNPEATFVF